VVVLMTVHPLGPDGFRYLIESVTRQDELPLRSVAHGRSRGGLVDYYLRSGNPPGEWLGSLAGGLGVAGEVGEQQMARLFGCGQHPVTGEQLGRRYPRYAPLSERVADRMASFAPRPDRVEESGEWYLSELSDGELADLDGYALAAVRERTGRRISDDNAVVVGLDGQAQRELVRLQERRRSRDRVAGVDLVFSPPKSVQSLWALATITGDVATRDQVEAWVRSARDATLRRLETEVAFGRLGAGGKVWVPVDGIAAAAFLHRSSRAGDPALHWHVAVASKVRVQDPVGLTHWVALDTRSLHKAAVSLSEMFNGEVERLAQVDGYRFAPRRDQLQHGSRAVRELVGIPEELNQAWSRRRAQVENNYERLLAGFRGQKGRDPQPHEQYRLAQQACLIDRPAKAPGLGAEDEIAFWEHLARHALGDNVDLQKVIAATRPDPKRPTDTPVHAADLGEPRYRQLVRRTVQAVSEKRPWWTVRHLQAEAERQTRGIHFATTGDRQQVVCGIVAAATTPDRYLGPSLGVVVRAERRSVVAEPARLLRPDGESVFREPAAIEYTSTRMLTAEDRVLRAAQASGAPRISTDAVEHALTRAVASGRKLAPDQEAAIRALAGSGRWLELLIGPAGAGKTTTLRVLVDAAYLDGWTVIGLAPSAKAARILGDNTGVRIVENTRQWELNLATNRVTPRPRTLVLIDEASLGHAPTLEAIITAHLNAGGITRLIGDPRQLTSPGAGGLLRWVHQQHGGVELTSLWRFRHQWEAAATLRLRDGDPSVIEDYLAHDRVQHGSAAAMKDQLYQWWLTQRHAGHSALMLVQSNADVADLSARARRDLIAAGLVEEAGTRLRDGNDAGHGDQIVTRRIDRSLRYNRSDYVRNGDTWHVTTRHEDGSLTLTHADNHGRIRIGADWLNQWAELAYAVTGTRAQGMTVHAAGSLLYPESTTRNAAYTQLTRGTHDNRMWLITDTVLDPDGEPIEHANLDPAAAFTAILGRIDDDSVAHERLTEATETEHSIRTLSSRYQYVHSLIRAGQDATADTAAAIDPDRAADLNTLPNRLAEAVRADTAWPALAACLQALAALGHDTAAELAAAAAERELDTADSAAQVLHWRLGRRIPALDTEPSPPAAEPTRPGNERIPVAPWLPAPPTDIPPALADLVTYLHRTRAAIDIRAATLAARGCADACLSNPTWAAELGVPPPAGPQRSSWLLLAARIAAYREAFTITDPRPLGDLPAQAGQAQQLTHATLAAALAEHHRSQPTPEPHDDKPVIRDASDRAQSADDPPLRVRGQVHDPGRSTGHTPSLTLDQAALPVSHDGTYATLSDRALADEIARATRAAQRTREQADTIAEHADRIAADADRGNGPAVQHLHTHADDLARRVAAITAARPLAAAYTTAVDNLARLESHHAQLLRRQQPTTRRPRRAPSGSHHQHALSDLIAAATRQITALRTELDAQAGRLGEATGAAGPAHEWAAACGEHADLQTRYTDSLTAAHALDRAAADPWYHRAAALRDQSTRHEQHAQTLRHEQRYRSSLTYASQELKDIWATDNLHPRSYGPAEPDAEHLSYLPPRNAADSNVELAPTARTQSPTQLS
jgi:conjugative relaxase-like TrwC/TraI family protein